MLRTNRIVFVTITFTGIFCLAAGQAIAQCSQAVSSGSIGRVGYPSYPLMYPSMAIQRSPSYPQVLATRDQLYQAQRRMVINRQKGNSVQRDRKQQNDLLAMRLRRAEETRKKRALRIAAIAAKNNKNAAPGTPSESTTTEPKSNSESVERPSSLVSRNPFGW